MLSVYFGNDVTQVRTRALAALGKLPGEVRKITVDSYERGMLPELSESASLFGNTEVILLDTLSEGGEDILDEIVEHAEGMSESAHHFIMIESALSATHKKKIETYADAKEITAEKEDRFNTFSLTDALLSRDKKTLWLLLQEALRRGHSHEELIGILFWQLKTLRLVEKTRSAEEAGLKPFVYSKAKRALSSFKTGELESLSSRLLSVYHEGHMGKHDTGIALEGWILSL